MATAHPGVYVDDPADPEIICPVCREQFDEGTVASRLMCCRNEVCEGCHCALVARHFATCPICRADLPSPPSSPTPVVVPDSDSDSDSDSDMDMDSDPGPDPGPDPGTQHFISPYADLYGVDSESESESASDDDDFVPGAPQPTTVWATRSALA